MNNPQEIRELIIKLVREKGTSINKMLEDCKLGSGTVDSMKAGKKPSAINLATIARFLNVSTDYLLGLTDLPQKYEYEFSFEEMKIVQAYRNNPDMQGAVKRILMLDDVESESIDKKEA